jgi:hypothetical protein
MLQVKLLGKQEQANHKMNRRREMIKMRAEINKVDTEKTIQSSNKIKSRFFEKINKIDKLLLNRTKIRRKKTQINKIRNEKG